MSQAGSNSSGGTSPGGPVVIVTNTGGAQVIANQLSIIGDDTTANNNNGITTSGATSVVTVLLTNRLEGSGTSAAGATTNLITFPLAVNTVYRFELKIAGRSTVGAFVGEGVGYSVFATAKRIAGAASIVGTPFNDNDEDANLAGCSVAFVASGNNVILQVTGIASETIVYQAVGYYTQV